MTAGQPRPVFHLLTLVTMDVPCNPRPRLASRNGEPEGSIGNLLAHLRHVVREVKESGDQDCNDRFVTAGVGEPHHDKALPVIVEHPAKLYRIDPLGNDMCVCHVHPSLLTSEQLATLENGERRARP